VHEQAIAVAERLGYPRFDDVGKPFDPHRHEAVASIEGAGAPGTVIAAIRPGYGRDDTILRPADVVVAKAPA
jgi:molecular chaperone GrpE